MLILGGKLPVERMTEINFKKGKGLIPAIIQDYKTGEILMLGYMNREALKKTLKDRLIWLWSRSRKELWLKGKTSGNKLKLKEIKVDCDGDALLIKVELLGQAACHTGSRTCFYKNINDN